MHRPGPLYCASAGPSLRATPPLPPPPPQMVAIKVIKNHPSYFNQAQMEIVILHTVCGAAALRLSLTRLRASAPLPPRSTRLMCPAEGDIARSCREQQPLPCGGPPWHRRGRDEGEGGTSCGAVDACWPLLSTAVNIPQGSFYTAPLGSGGGGGTPKRLGQISSGPSAPQKKLSTTEGGGRDWTPPPSSPGAPSTQPKHVRTHRGSGCARAERPIGPAKGKQTNTMALCQAPTPFKRSPAPNCTMVPLYTLPAPVAAGCHVCLGTRALQSVQPHGPCRPSISRPQSAPATGRRQQQPNPPKTKGPSATALEGRPGSVAALVGGGTTDPLPDPSQHPCGLGSAKSWAFMAAQSTRDTVQARTLPATNKEHTLRTRDSRSGGAYVVDGRDNAWRSRAPGPHAQVVDSLRTERWGQQKQANHPRDKQAQPQYANN